MTTILQTTEVYPVAKELAAAKLQATFTEQADATDWVFMSGNIAAQMTGPLEAGTIAIERSTVDPGGGAPSIAEISDATGDPETGGVQVTLIDAPAAWYRVQNKATFGPATDVANRTLDSLVIAVNGGQQYPVSDVAAGTVPQPLVVAERTANNVVTLTAATAGTAANSIATTETLTNGAFGGATLSGGAEAVAASGVVTFATAAASAGETVTIGTTVYTFVASLTDTTANQVLPGASLTASRDNLLLAINAGGAPSTGTLTLTANAGNNETVQIGNKVYTFKTTLTGADNEVLIGANASASIDNLIAAINSAAGGGTVYGVNTARNPDVTAAAGAGDTMDVTSTYSGSAANAIRTRETLANGSWGGALMTGATGAGVSYSSATVAHPSVTGAATSTNAITVTASTAGAAGNAIATTETGANISWGGATLSSGADAVKATGTLTMSGAFVDTNTVTIGAVTYTFVTTLTPTAGQIMIAGLRGLVSLNGQRQANV